MVHECPTLVVLDALLSAPPLEVHRFFRWYLNRVASCLRYSNFFPPIFANGASGFGFISDYVKSTADSADRSVEDMNDILVLWGKRSTLYPPISTLVVFTYI